MEFLTDPTRFLFFTGKGGVGKTSLACAASVRMAESGRRVLLVSTDPASNVGQVFGLPVGNTVTPVPGVPGLDALEIDPEQAAEAYRERIVAPVRGLLPDKEIASITEQLSGSCTTEIASFNEFTGLLADPDQADGYDHVVFDTAPTGHTLRLLKLPGEWTGFLDAGLGDASCLGPLAGLEKQRSLYRRAVDALADPALSRLVLVARAQQSSLAEAARTADELRLTGIAPSHLVVNALLGEDAGGDPLALAIRRRERRALDGLPEALAVLPRDLIALKPDNMVGLPALRSLLEESTPGLSQQTPPVTATHPEATLDALVEELVASGPALVMCMGKGGVGKTTVAAAIAVRLAGWGHRVHLTTTDPAAHLDRTVGAGAVANLTLSRVDPGVAVQDYRDHVLATKGKDLDEAGQALLAEDLRSPCTEEVAVFRQFSRLVHEARRHYVVMDTAPTGHTLLLMDATGSYHREIVRSMPGNTHFSTPLMRLQDPDHTKILLVTLPETTPVLEASVLEDDLVRAGIKPWAWVVNQSVAAAETTSPLLRQRGAQEQLPMAMVRARATRVAVVPLLAEEPVGAEALSGLASAASGRGDVLQDAR